MYFSRGDGYFNVFTPNGDEYQVDLSATRGVNIIPGDFNGDGKTDFIRQTPGAYDGSKAQFAVYFSSGDGTFSVKQPPLIDWCQNQLRSDLGSYLLPGDFNGDGKTDFVRHEHTNLDDDPTYNVTIWLSKGDGSFRDYTPPSLDQNKLKADLGARLIPGDFDGNGFIDFIRQEHGEWSANANHTFSVFFSSGGEVATFIAQNWRGLRYEQIEWV